MPSWMPLWVLRRALSSLLLPELLSTLRKKKAHSAQNYGSSTLSKGTVTNLNRNESDVNWCSLSRPGWQTDCGNATGEIQKAIERRECNVKESKSARDDYESCGESDKST